MRRRQGKKGAETGSKAKGNRAKEKQGRQGSNNKAGVENAVDNIIQLAERGKGSHKDDWGQGRKRLIWDAPLCRRTLIKKLRTGD